MIDKIMKKAPVMNKKVLILLVSGLIIYSNSFSCTIFTFTSNGKTYFCNNEDYSNPDTEIRFYPSKNGKYAWVYFGFSNNWAQGGVNEKGLCWDWVAGIKEDSWKADKAKETISGNPSEKMITECSTVEEAIKFYEKYNDVSFSYARTMIADKYGNSAIIGWKDGRINIQRNNGNLQAFGYRGQAVESYFSDNPGEINIAYTAEALNVAHQEGRYPTQYSNIISLSDGKIYLYKSHNYSEHVEIDYLTKLNKAYSKYKVFDLFDVNKSYSEIVLVKNESIIKKNTPVFGQESFKTDTFSFSFEGKRLHGYIDIPLDYKPDAVIIIVGGHGKTNYWYRDWYNDSLYKCFTNQGLACVRWDKAGCGKSEGEYNHNQTVQNSAEELIAAFNELKRRKIPGSENIGLWGISRAGYICPIAIQQYPEIKFWISVSGTDGLNSSDYMFESHLRLSGKSDSEAKQLVDEYKSGGMIFENGGTIEEYIKATENFRNDSLCIAYTGADTVISKESYYKEQASVIGNITHKRDSATKSVILVPDFNNLLNKIQCPVLAIFGEKDSQVDWKKTLNIYQETIGKKNKLTTKTFPNGNHAIIKCQTGSPNEYLDKMEFCEGFLETTTAWLKENGFGK